jgi:membrane fusion protein, multidrug efflux system
MNRFFQLIFLLNILFFYSCKKEKTPEQAAVKVEAGEVVKQSVRNFIESIGNVYESSLVQIRPQVQGILLKAYVKQGNFVKSGELLYEIDPRPYKASLDQAKATLLKDIASLDIAKRTVKRYTDVAKRDFISPLTFEQYISTSQGAKGQVAADMAALEIAKINLDYCTITSPIDGRVSLFNIYPGNLVVVNDPTALIEIRQVTPVDIRFTITQRDFQEVQKIQAKEDLKFEVLLPYENNRKFEGTLYFIDNHVDLQSGTVLLKGIILNEDLALWPGQFVRVHLFTITQEHALVVPYSAIQIGQKGSFVYVIEADETVKIVPVTTGQKFDSYIVVNSGLNLGDKIVTKGQLNLRNGAKIVISNPSEELEKTKQ